MEEEGNNVESQEMYVDVVDDMSTKSEVENFTIRIDDDILIKCYNCNLCSSRRQEGFCKEAYHGQTYLNKKREKRLTMRMIKKKKRMKMPRKLKRLMSNMCFKLRAWPCSPAHRLTPKFYRSLQLKTTQSLMRKF